MKDIDLGEYIVENNIHIFNKNNVDFFVNNAANNNIIFLTIYL